MPYKPGLLPEDEPQPKFVMVHQQQLELLIEQLQLDIAMLYEMHYTTMPERIVRLRLTEERRAQSAKATFDESEWSRIGSPSFTTTTVTGPPFALSRATYSASASRFASPVRSHLTYMTLPLV